MSRIARVVAVGVAHHITQRGNNRQAVLLDDKDREMYLYLLREQLTRAEFRLLGYCLMPNHTHLIAIPDHPLSFWKGLGRLHLKYTQYFNLRYRRSGRVWQNRFYSCPLGRTHLTLAVRYVDLNPVRAGMVSEASSYPWSSAVAHIRHEDRWSLLDLGRWRDLDSLREWRDVLSSAEHSADEWQDLRNATITGRPFADREFSEELERRLSRSLIAKPPGRPRKKESETPVLSGSLF